MGCSITISNIAWAIILIHSIVYCNPNISKSTASQKHSRIVVENCQEVPSLQVGDTLDIKLTGFPARGYSWQLKHTPDSISSPIRFLKKNTTVNQDSKDDSEQVTTFTFITLDQSLYTLEFEYKRPWEKTSISQKNCSFLLHIK